MCNNNYKVDKFLVSCRVLGNKNIGNGMFQMKIGGKNILKICKKASAGQFINIYLKDKSAILPRPISICNIENSNLEIVYKVVGKGTIELSKYQEGEDISISSSLGNGYCLEEWNAKMKPVLVGGGAGIPPMIQLAKELNHIGCKVTCIFGFQSETFLINEAKKLCEDLYICTETGEAGFKGNVMELIKNKSITGDGYFACGPKPMLKSLNKHCSEKNLPLQVSMEERMGCGYGACVGCAIKLKIDGEIVQKAVCKDGPVFNGSEVVWNE